jgi:radical SAM protein with 4Fe4S-binding SPASM domain
MVEAAQVCKDLGLDFIKFRPFFGGKTIVDEEFEEALKLATSEFQVLRSGYRYDRRVLESNDRGYKKCLSPNFETVIAATGKVYVCCHMIGNENYEIGDLNTATFREIWEDDKRQDVINGITFEDCPLVCKWHVLNTFLDSQSPREENIGI